MDLSQKFKKLARLLQQNTDINAQIDAAWAKVRTLHKNHGAIALKPYLTRESGVWVVHPGPVTEQHKKEWAFNEKKLALNQIVEEQEKGFYDKPEALKPWLSYCESHQVDPYSDAKDDPAIKKPARFLAFRR